jgi:DNA-binding CsgD family transcriptional regulator
MAQEYNYKVFRKFLNARLARGFLSVDPADAFLMDIVQKMKPNAQFFYIADMARMTFLFVSPGSDEVIGVEPAKVDPGLMISITHTDDIKRHQLARSHAIRLSNDIYSSKKGIAIISTNVRATRNGTDYFDLLYQGYLFHSGRPLEAVFLLMVLTDISKLGIRMNKYHYYTGYDPEYFRFPDRKLLATGSLFTNSEHLVLQLIESGLSTVQIAQKLFRSAETIETHRKNIIKKSGLPSTKDVVISLKNQGQM